MALKHALPVQTRAPQATQAPRKRLPGLRLTLLPLAAGVLVACASAPATNPVVEEARAVYQQAVTNPDAARSAATELRNAQVALQQADAALRDGGNTAEAEHQAYLARQSASVALQAGQIAQAELAVTEARAERERILLQARTREAQQQQAVAVQAQSQARLAQTEAQQALSAAERARQEAEDARRLAEERLATEAAARAKTAQLQAQLAELQAQSTDRGMVLTLGDVLFDTGRAELKPGATSTLDRLAQFMRDQPERSLLVEGHTDAVGSDALNLRLSQQRADAVRAALLQRGVAADRISTEGLGKARPVASNDSAEGRQRNRRVEIVIQGA